MWETCSKGGLSSCDKSAHYPAAHFSLQDYPLEGLRYIGYQQMDRAEILQETGVLTAIAVENANRFVTYGNGNQQYPAWSRFTQRRDEDIVDGGSW